MPTSSVSLTKDLGAFVSSFEDVDQPQEVAMLIKLGMIDCLGVMIAGASEPLSRIVRETCSTGGTESSLWLGPGRSDAMSAALINATAAHALDFDDVAIQGHFSAVLLPAIMAEAEALGLSGRKMLDAYLVGYEVWAGLISRQLDPVHRKGWHPTGVFGAVGAAAACAYLRGLNAEQSSHALAIAASQSGGVVANFGSMTKPLHAGRAAQGGVLAARLAQAGLTGSADAIEGPAGLMAATSYQGRLDLTSTVPKHGAFYFLRQGLTFKKFPTCLSTHRPIEAALRLREHVHIDVEAIDRVEVSMSRRNAEILHEHNPVSALQAKFSVEFAVAIALSVGALGLSELDDSVLMRPDIGRLMSKVVTLLDDREDPITGYAPYDEVSITMQDGRRMTERIDAIPGSPASPLSGDQVWTKFRDCLDHGRSNLDRRWLFDTFIDLETVTDLRTVTLVERQRHE